MVRIVEQRKYIQDFLDFTGSYLLTEQVTVSEFNLIKANLEILNERIAEYENKTIIGSGGHKSNINKNSKEMADRFIEKLQGGGFTDDKLSGEEIDALLNGVDTSRIK